MTAFEAPPTNPRSFPAHTFAKLSPHDFLHANLTSSENTRPSGRTPSQARTVACNSSSLSHMNGSAVFRLGDTVAVCGVRAEILRVDDIADYQPQRENVASEDDEDDDDDDGEFSDEERERKRRKICKEEADEMARLNLLVPNVDLATGCSPAHLPGGPPSAQAQSLSQRMLTLLHISQLVDFRKLRIWYHPPPPPPPPFSQGQGSPDEMTDISTDEEKGVFGGTENPPKAEIKAFWTLYMDILFLSLDGNPFDAAWGSMIAALKDVRLPRAQWNTDLDTVLCDNNAAHSVRLWENRALPVPLSFGVFVNDKRTEGAGDKWLLIDMDGFEEGIVREDGTIVVQGHRKEALEIVRIEKNGGDGIGPGEVRELVRRTNERWIEWASVLA